MLSGIYLKWWSEKNLDTDRIFEMTSNLVPTDCGFVVKLTLPVTLSWQGESYQLAIIDVHVFRGAK